MNACIRSRLALTALLATTACGGGGGGGGGPTLGNLTVTNVRLVSTDPNAAHQMTLAVSVASTQRYDNVPITYVLLNFIADILYTVLNPRVRL